MTPTQAKFVELEKKKEEVKKYFEELNNALDEVYKETGFDGMFQDGEGTVYKVVQPEGKFVAFDKIGYVRTKRPGEFKGSLSKKEAEGAGFKLQGE